MDDRVAAQGLAHPLGTERAAAQRDHPRVRPAEQVEHDLFLARAKGSLTLAIEVALDRLSELAFKLAVGVERIDRELRCRDACGRGLAGAHEADEDERPRAGGRRPRGGQRFHPIRSR